MEIKFTGHEKRTERALKLYKEWYRLYSDPKKPMSVKEISMKYKKPDGSNYTVQYIYKGFRILAEYENNNGLLEM